MTSRKILFVEDEENLLNSFSFILENAGYEVLKAANGETALSLISENPPDLAILDVGLPGMDGHAVAKKIRENKSTFTIPIVMLTGRKTEDEIIKALETVVDDYICKPVNPRMLLARISSLLRRTGGLTQKDHEKTLKCGNIIMDTSSRTVASDGNAVKLTRSEFDILALLMQSPEHVFSRETIISSIRGDDFYITERSIDFLISGLRKKLGSNGDIITTVRGIGFKLTDSSDQ